MIRRREFIAALGGAAAWPLAARAQQPAGARKISVLTSGLQDDLITRNDIGAFRETLQKQGWIEGRNISVDYRFGRGDVSVLTALAKELVEGNPDVIVVSTTPGTAALLRETRIIPIVFVSVADPVGSGFVESFARPSGNVTGFTNYEYATMSGKWLEILKDLAPSIRRAAILFNPDTSPAGGSFFLGSFEAAASAIALEPITAAVRSDTEIGTIMTELAREPGTGLVVVADIFNTVHRALIIALAARYKLPAVYAFRFFATDGGLTSYGVDLAEQYRQAAVYVDRILKGAKPADLPVQAPTKYELVVNLKTAKALGLAVPPSIRLRADEVIE
jgi:putative ABC transport system substrate-binding protein